MHFHAPPVGPHQPFDDHRVLIALVLHPQGMLCLVDEFTHPLPSVADAPDQVALVAGIETLALPIGVEAFHHLVHFVAMRSHHRIIARLGQVLGLPVQGLDEGSFVIHHHRLLMGDVEGRIAVDHLDGRVGQDLAHVGIFFLAAAARRVQHDPHLHAPPVRRDHRMQKLRIGEQEHLDAQRFLGTVDGLEYRPRGIIGHDNQVTRHMGLPTANNRFTTEAQSSRSYFLFFYFLFFYFLFFYFLFFYFLFSDFCFLISVF